MDEWMNIISKRELSQDEIRKLRFRPKKVEAAERKLKLRQKPNFVPRKSNFVPRKSKFVPTQQRIDREKEQIDQSVSQATSNLDNKSTAGRLQSKQQLMEELVRITGDKNAVMNIKGAATTEKLTQAIQEAAKNKKEKLQQSRDSRVVQKPAQKPAQTETSSNELTMEQRIKNVDEEDKMKETQKTPAEKPAPQQTTPQKPAPQQTTPQKPPYKIEPGLKESLTKYLSVESNKTKDPNTRQRLLDLINVLRGQQ